MASFHTSGFHESSPARRLERGSLSPFGLGDPHREARVVKDEPEPVVDEHARKVELGRVVVVAGPLGLVGQARVVLLQSLYTEVERAHICGGRIHSLTDLEAESVHR